MQLKVVLLISSLSGGGAEKIISALANFYANRGISVTLVTLDDINEKPDIYLLASKVSRQSIFVPIKSILFSKLFLYVKRYWLLRQLLRKLQPDVLLSFMTPTNLLAIAASRGLNIRSVVSERTNPSLFSYGRINEILRKLFYRFSDAIVVQTLQIANWLKPRTRGNIVVIPNFIIHDIPDEGAHLRKYYIIAVGRLSIEKCFDILIIAFARLIKEFPNWQLLIIGEGLERHSLENLIDKNDLSQKVTLCGFIENPVEIMKTASIVVQPSRFEGFPNALLEAMSCGLPCIATYQAGNMLIKNEVNGLLVPVDDIDSLTHSLWRLMSSSFLREQFGKAAAQVREIYSRKRILKLWDSVLFPEKTIEPFQ